MQTDRHEQVAHVLFRESNDALFLFDPGNHRVVEVNPTGLRLTGLARRAILGRPVWELFSSVRPDALDELMNAYARTGFFHSREGYSLCNASGDPIPVNLSASRIHIRPKPLGLVVVRDISERFRAADALRQSERRYRRLVESAGIIDWSIREDGTILQMNAQGGGPAAWEANEFRGRTIRDLLHAQDHDRLAALIDCVLNGNATAPFEVRVHLRDASIAHVEILSIDIAGEPGSRIIHGISRDISAQLSAIEALSRIEEFERAKEAAELANRTKSIFLANISHEIRTPMTAVIGLADLLLSDPDVESLPEERLEDLRTIRQNGHYLLDLINDLLDLTKADVDKLRVERVPCNPTEIVGEVIASLRGRAVLKGLSLELDPSEGWPERIATDPVRLRQILINLVANAIKFTERGEIRVRMRAGADPSSGERVLTIEVIDSGIGMTDEEIARLYEPFYSSSRQPFGAGLGLALSKRLSEMLGGRLLARSVLGQGSTFTLVIPAPFPAQAAKPNASTRRLGHRTLVDARLETRLDGMKILLAEDNDASRRVIRLHLERYGAAIITAVDGREAMERVLNERDAGHPVDVILMDMQMPVLDGYEATRQLRARGVATPIIALTAYATPEDRDECLRFGCDEHIGKPIEWFRLIGLITRCLSQRERIGPARS